MYTLTLDLQELALRELHARDAHGKLDAENRASPKVRAKAAALAGDAAMLLAWATYEQAWTTEDPGAEIERAVSAFFAAMRAYSAAYVYLCEADGVGAIPSDHALLMYARSKSAWLAGKAIES